MLNTSQFNQIQYNGDRTKFFISRIGSLVYNQWGYVKKVLSTPFNIAVLVYNKVRVFISKPKITIRTKQKFF